MPRPDHHAAEAAMHLLLRNLVRGMALETGIVDPVHLGVILQMTGHFHGIFAMPLHPDSQSLHSPRQRSMSLIFSVGLAGVSIYAREVFG